MLTWVVIVIVAFVIGFVIMAFNRFIRLRNLVENAWAQIDVQLRRRYDLVPNLVETVKGYAAHEKTVFQKVTEARAQAMSAKGVKEQGKAENFLTNALKTLFAVVENYPELKANQNFIKLQEDLADIENKIAFARELYNDMVLRYEVLRERFPTNLVGQFFRFKEKEYFEIVEAAARAPVRVEF